MCIITRTAESAEAGSASGVKRSGPDRHLKDVSGDTLSATTGRTDAELAADGDDIAFERLVAAHQAEMVRVAYVITCDQSLANDAVQSAWTRAWRKLGSLRDQRHPRPWLLRIAANEARQVLRARRRFSVVEIDPALPAGSAADPAGAIARIDLVRALAHLSPEDRALLALRYVAGLDAEELGRLTGRTASGTRARLSRITARMRVELGDDR
jgi:RNA polymerase sigma-70 factor (ECF subfamily)